MRNKYEKKVKEIPAHGSWYSMKQRCLNKNATGYSRYGGAGIKICDRWMEFDNFYADMGDRPEGMSLDRIDNDGNYEPRNCRWATIVEQSKNQKSNRKVEIDGVTKLITEWARDIGITASTLSKRLAKGIDKEGLLAPNPQSKRKTITSEFGEVNLYDLAKLSGVSYFTIDKRYKAGYRGDDLIVKRAKRRWNKKPENE